jgi:hypothetical protein
MFSGLMLSETLQEFSKLVKLIFNFNKRLEDFRNFSENSFGIKKSENPFSRFPRKEFSSYSVDDKTY